MLTFIKCHDTMHSSIEMTYERRNNMAALHITTDTFESEVLNSDKPVLIDFWATWCGPCQMQGPIIDDMADELTDVKVCKVNVDENPDLAKKYRVMSIPNLVVIENGELKAQEVGVHDRAGILDMLGK